MGLNPSSRKRQCVWNGVRAVLAAGFIAAGGLIVPAPAQEIQRIAALVNDKVVSAYDLEQRVKLVIATSGLNPTEEALERIREQVLRTLVDEELQLQEAQQFEVKVSDADIDGAISSLARRNNMRREDILGILQQAGVSENTLRRQIMASIAWDDITQGRFSSRISVTDEEVNQVIEQLESSADKPQYWLLEIFLSVDSPDEDESVRQTAENIVNQIRTGEAPFPDVARQFSQSASASNGGDAGWVTKEDLPGEIARVINQLRPGSLSVPIRTVGGYYIVAIRDKRIGTGAQPDQIKLKLKQVFVPALPDFPDEAVNVAGNAAYQISATNPGCDNVDRLVAEGSSINLRSSDLGERYVSDLTDPFQNAVTGVAGGESTQPVRSEIGFHVLLVCDRQLEGSAIPSREAIENRLFQQQLSMVQRRYLHDLRRDATVEIR